MNFEPDNILTPQQGNNADARTVSVRVMNDRTPTPAQLADLRRMFEEHRKALATALGGFLVKDNVFSDGTRARIVSNSGLHTIQLWPAGGRTLLELVEDFWGIPANYTQINGPLVPPSGYWRVREEDREMPPELKQKRYYGLADDPTHPGHVTWSSPHFLADKEEVVLAWRGPRDRYAATTGWSTSTGGSQVAHNNAGQSIGDDVFKDSSYLWINGRKVATPVVKIIAAALHRPDPSGDPDGFVLRVCTDNVSGDGTTRKVGVKDLVPTGETAPVTLSALLTATSYTVLNSYTATNNGLAAGQWELMQRPHFDKDGARLACTIRQVTGGMTSAVSLNATTFAILQQFDFTETHVRVGSQSWTDTGSGSNPRTITFDRTQTDEATILLPLAADFLGADFVYAYLEQHTTNGYIAEEERVRTDPGGGDPIVVTHSHSYTHPRLRELKVKHSLHGNLLVDTQDRTYATTYSSPPAAGSFPATSYPTYNRVSFVANLARDVFAVGYSVSNGVVETAGTGTPYFLSGWIYLASTRQTTFRPMTYDLWMAGVKRVSNTSGSFTNDAPFSNTATAIDGQISYNIIDNEYLGGSLSTPPNGTTVSPAVCYDVNRMSRAIITPPEWAHIACNAERSVAYMGVYNRVATGTTPSHINYGLEACCFLPPGEAFTLAAVPAYAAANPRPTISAPVFPGVTRKELVQ